MGKRTGQLVTRLQREYLAAAGQPTAWAAAQHAALRSADPFVLGDAPEAWALVWDGLDARLVGRGDRPSPGEQAIFSALVLYAIHQQARTVPMHRDGVSLGAAARRLSYVRSGSGEVDDAVLRRFTAVALADEPEQRIHHLRTFVRLLRSDQVPLDYARLAKDLFDLSWPSRVSGIRTRWARDLYRRPTDDDSSDETSSATTTTTTTPPENGAA